MTIIESQITYRHISHGYERKLCAHWNLYVNLPDILICPGMSLVSYYRDKLSVFIFCVNPEA